MVEPGAIALAEEFLLMQDGCLPEAIIMAEDLPEGEFRDQVLNHLDAKWPIARRLKKIEDLDFTNVTIEHHG